jgi:phosphatidylglycerol:prolipoprotein diacylglycerol transferase
MYAVALLAGARMPYYHLGSIELPFSIGPLHEIQWFGIIVAAGVLIGASLLRRYAEWHGVPDEHIRGLTGWITVAGFIGAHVFDVVAYQWSDLMEEPLLFFKVWSGISSYGGFLGGAMGFAFYVWWKRLPPRLMADIALVGLLPAFSLGRIGCTVVSDHIGAAVDPEKWYAALAMDYPRHLNLAHLADTYPGVSEYIRAWNLGLIEFLYLVPVNLVFLYLAFRASKRINAGFLTVMAGVLYAPVRFFLDFLRPEETDPRHLGLTFAQWSSFLAFGAAIYFATKVFKNGKPAETITRTSGEAQARLKIVLREHDDKAKADAKAGKDVKPSLKVVEKQDEAEKEAQAAAKAEARAEAARAELRAEKAAAEKAAAGAQKPAAKKAEAKKVEKAEAKVEKAEAKAEKAETSAEKAEEKVEKAEVEEKPTDARSTDPKG